MPESKLPISFSSLDGVEWQSIRNEFTATAALAVDQSHVLISKSQWGDYLDCYWRHFHPLFPILHHPTTTLIAPPPALAMLMVIIGAQFSTFPASKVHSTFLYDSCLTLFATVSFRTTMELCSFVLTSGIAEPSYRTLLSFGYADDRVA